MLPFDKVVWVLVSSRIQVQLQIILDPDCLIVIRVVAAMLLIMVKFTDTFLRELQKIWVFQI